VNEYHEIYRVQMRKMRTSRWHWRVVDFFGSLKGFGSAKDRKGARIDSAKFIEQLRLDKRQE
jgi:hypothetical protein